MNAVQSILKLMRWRSRALCIGVHYTDGGCDVGYCETRISGKKLSVKRSGVADAGQLNLLINKWKGPVVLAMTGNSILCKVQPTSSLTEGDLHRLLPLPNKEDFEVQCYKGAGTSSYLAFCRKSLLSDLLESIAGNKSKVAVVYLGAAAIWGIRSIATNGVCYNAGSGVATFDGPERMELSGKEQNNADTVRFGDIELPANCCIPLAAGLLFHTRDQSVLQAEGQVTRLQETYENSVVYKNVLKLLVSMVLVIAVVNALGFQHFYTRNQETRDMLAAFQRMYDKKLQFEADSKNNIEFIKRCGLWEERRLAEYVDRICSTKPVNGIRLMEIEGNPVLNHDRSLDSLLRFAIGTFVIRGLCKESFILDSWLSRLKSATFVSDVFLENYHHDENNDQPNFKLKVLVK